MPDSLLWSIGAFFIVLTPIILVHELGHFWAARLSNVRVEEFGLGFPPRAVKLFERGGTLYSLNWIPLGGFVRPAGEDDPTVPGGLAAASKKARLFVLSAGAIANFILAVLILWGANMLGAPAVEIGYVNEGSPAEAAGMMEGDVILEADGVLVENTGTIIELVNQNLGQPMPILVDRNGEERLITVVPRGLDEFDPAVEGPIGVGLRFSSSGYRISQPPLAAAQDAVTSVWEIVSLTVRVPAMLISGEITAEQARPVSVVGISQIAGEAAETSVSNNTLYPILTMAAYISVALGFTNLLPIPALDGGRILFVLIEAVRGRRVEPEREMVVHMVGMLFLLGLMVLLIVQDIVNPIF